MSNGAFDLFVKGRVLHCKTRPFSCQNAAFYSAKGRIWHFILILLVLRSDDGEMPAKPSGVLFVKSRQQFIYVFLNGLVSHVFKFSLVRGFGYGEIKHGEQYAGKNPRQ